MPENDLFSDLDFARPDADMLGCLRHHLDPETGVVRPMATRETNGALARALHRAITDMGGGCRLAASPGAMFKVTAGTCNIVTRCGHGPYHEWHGTRRVK